MKKENKKSLFTQLLTYAVVLAIFIYILYSIITSSLAGRINQLYGSESKAYTDDFQKQQEVLDSKSSTETQKSAATKEQGVALNNLLKLASAVQSGQNQLSGYYVTNEPISFKINIGDKATASMDANETSDSPSTTTTENGQPANSKPADPKTSTENGQPTTSQPTDSKPATENNQPATSQPDKTTGKESTESKPAQSKPSPVINVDFYAYGIGDQNGIKEVKGYIGYVSKNQALTDISQQTFIKVSIKGVRNLPIIFLTEPLKDKDNKPTDKLTLTQSPILFNIPLSKDITVNNLEIDVMEQNVASNGDMTGTPEVLYAATNDASTSQSVNTQKLSLESSYNAAASTYTAKKLSDYNGKLAINVIIVIIVFAIIVYIFFIHKHVKAYLANKKQKRNSEVEAEEVKEETVQEATVEEVQQEEPKSEEK